MVKPVRPPRAVHFPGMVGTETFQFYYRQHWMRLRRALQGFVLGTLLFGGAIWLLADTPDDDTRRMLLMIAVGSFLVLQLSLLARFYQYFLYMIVVTDTKVYRIKQTLLMTDDRQTIDLWSLSDVTMHQHGLFQNMFGFGTLVLIGNETLKIHFTPRIRDKVHRITMLRTQARARATGNIPPPNKRENRS